MPIFIQMKLFAHIIVRILIGFAALLAPVALLVAFFTLRQRGIPAWNIGARNIVTLARSYSVPIVTISYIAATLFTVALIDKTKIRSIVLLHIAPIFAGILILGGLFIVQRERRPFPQWGRTLTLGHRVFLKEGVFNDAGDLSLIVRYPGKGTRTLHVYNRARDALETVPDLRYERDRSNALYVDDEDRAIVVKRRGARIFEVPYREFASRKATAGARILGYYALKVRDTARILEDYGSRFGRRDRYVLAAALLLSALMLSIPLTFALNDAGWGFSGITGAVLILAFLPFLYWGVFRILQTTGFRTYLNVGYGYLFPPAVMCLLGILIDLLIKIKAKR